MKMLLCLLLGHVRFVIHPEHRYPLMELRVNDGWQAVHMCARCGLLYGEGKLAAIGSDLLHKIPINPEAS